MGMVKMNFSHCSQPLVRLRLGNAQINLRFLSPCTNFAVSYKHYCQIDIYVKTI